MQLREYYRWQIILDNNSVINQSKEGEESFKFDNRNPDFNKVKIFKLIPKEGNSQLSEVTVEIPNGAKLIYFRRTIANTGNMHPKFQLTLIGWQMNTCSDNKGKNIKYILYIYPDGKVFATSDSNPSVEDFIASLPQKNPEDVIGCSGCKPVLERAKSDE